MNTSLDESYFIWLYCQVLDVEDDHPSHTYWELMKRLFNTEFLWFIPHDDDRTEDGRKLRREFLNEEGIQSVDDNWMKHNCTMLEMLIGLSRRLSFVAEGEPGIWFWSLLENLGLEQFNDNSPPDEGYIEGVLKRVIFRTYQRNGRGGLFPLNHPKEDQRYVEIWYQKDAYLLENGY